MCRTTKWLQWRQRVSDDELLQRLGLHPALEYVRRRKLLWLGTVARMPNTRQPKLVLGSWLPRARAKGGGPRISLPHDMEWWLKREGLSCREGSCTWVTAASDEIGWKQRVYNGKPVFDPAAGKRGRAARRPPPPPPPTPTRTYLPPPPPSPRRLPSPVLPHPPNPPTPPPPPPTPPSPPPPPFPEVPAHPPFPSVPTHPPFPSVPEPHPEPPPPPPPPTPSHPSPPPPLVPPLVWPPAPPPPPQTAWPNLDWFLDLLTGAIETAVPLFVATSRLVAAAALRCLFAAARLLTWVAAAASLRALRLVAWIAARLLRAMVRLAVVLEPGALRMQPSASCSPSARPSCSLFTPYGAPFLGKPNCGCRCCSRRSRWHWRLRDGLAHPERLGGCCIIWCELRPVVAGWPAAGLRACWLLVCSASHRPWPEWRCVRHEQLCSLQPAGCG